MKSSAEARTPPGEGVAMTSLDGMRPNAAADSQRSTVEKNPPLEEEAVVTEAHSFR